MTSHLPNGRTQRIRDYLREHPACRSLEIAHALQESTREVNHDLRRMESQHIVLGDHSHGYGKSRFTLNPTPPAPQRRPSQPRQMPANVTAIRAQSSEEFIAHGGCVQRIASHWDTHPVSRVGWNPVQGVKARHA